MMMRPFERVESWIPGTSPGMTALVVSDDDAAIVIPAFIAGIHQAACSGVCGWLDTGNKPRYDSRQLWDGRDG